MPNKFSSGKFAIAQCDRCDFRFKLTELRTETVKTKPYKVKVCKSCWNPDQPQLQLGMYPVNDPQAVREPRPDLSYIVSGTSGLQELLTDSNSQQGIGYPEGGSRQIYWGWNPVGMGSDGGVTPNTLIGQAQLGTVTITTS
jgi:hypothetical protein